MICAAQSRSLRRKRNGKTYDLIHDQSPLRALLQAAIDGLEQPFLLVVAGDRSSRVELDGKLGDVSFVLPHLINAHAQHTMRSKTHIAIVCHVAVVHPRVEGDDIKEIAELEVAPDPLLVRDVNFSNRDPLRMPLGTIQQGKKTVRAHLMVRALRIRLSLGEADAFARCAAAAQTLVRS